MKHLICFFTTLLLFSCSTENKIEETLETPNLETYYPDNNTDKWDTISLNDLNWNEAELQPLLDYLDEKNTKGFIILYDGRIVVENYFNNHTASTNWYWASAGKTLTATVAGIANDNNLISLDEKVSTYLNQNWTSISIDKENLITCENLLNMTSGLDDSLGDSTSADNLKYIADANNRWAYHNVYLKMQDIIATASKTTFKSYFENNLKNKIGMSGSWIKLNDLNIYWSTTRSMARFGLLIQNKGKWNDTQIVSEDFIRKATSTSQNINKSYGYLWWLNGKTSYHLPQSQFEFSGSLIPNAPNDLFCALGKNDQKIYIVPSKKLVIVRMGASADASNFALSNFDNNLWEKINTLIN
ncbi:serine hydrolase [Polaribacter sp. KT 15]|uniref:serine hydrolase domain-containing protein n=1 Tax=Polaribacter sp. KT 15 TaxID=1896175 RepID=UPI00090B05CB|nr:serine hydrolase [Polaribacter sp. KT 15]SHM73313.1 CubicO group peptidase, beta-lactamase class C family [Polaribacter sp. KT 15]